MTGRDGMLVGFLRFAVPVEILRLRDATDEQRAHIAHGAVETVGSRGDVIQFRASGTAGATAALIRGLAALAYQPGGVTFAGEHWCVDHDPCLAPGDPTPTPRAVEEVALP